MEISGLHIAELAPDRAAVRCSTSEAARLQAQIAPVLDYGALERGDRAPIVRGPEPAFAAVHAEPAPATRHEISIDGLSPGVGYYLRLRAHPAGGAGGRGSAARQLLFTTAVPEPSSLSSWSPLKELLLAGLVDGSAQVLPAVEVEREYEKARRCYRDAGAGGRLEITDRAKLDAWQGLGG